MGIHLFGNTPGGPRRGAPRLVDAEGGENPISVLRQYDVGTAFIHRNPATDFRDGNRTGKCVIFQCRVHDASTRPAVSDHDSHTASSQVKSRRERRERLPTSHLITGPSGSST